MIEKIFKKKIYFSRNTILDFIQIIEVSKKKDIMNIMFDNRIELFKKNKELILDIIHIFLNNVCIKKSKNFFFQTFEYQTYLYIKFNSKKYKTVLKEESEEKKKKNNWSYRNKNKRNR